MADEPVTPPAPTPGWQTSEFWIQLAGQAVMLCVLLFRVSPGDASSLQATVTAGVTAIFTVISSAMMVIAYIRSRTDVKTTYTKSASGQVKSNG